ncbi:lipoprotein-releasing ABC transporter ATP-binding protein LolD [Candidatus Thioglobus sp.]|uniref:lipoprotein-releasing ABC transporter ATP-binding protein LolD n=1 Tax=Candidatus Thioglobus sp. TaxID=2026721 RepID=UPI0026320235|nr:lipoprotein-releasing ABC transporter ATP-binding protein LolD [Candidatus Thioglobus sp.]MDG2395253.1 lipoprotein-releasing ABC transporter ATP-binding protein LolD [Candidatus Thioglobus sp.]
MNSIIKCRKISYHYNDGTNNNQIINNLDLVVQPAESIAILGQSGCGKSTLLNLLGGMDKPTQGQIVINKTDLNGLSESQMTELRADNLGFVYQFHHLLKDFNALKNVMMPLLIQGESQAQAQTKALEILTTVGLDHRLNHLPSELSGGERQRIAIARALVTKPNCLLADEPTGNLDNKNAIEVLNLMIELNQAHDSALIIVTHDEKIAKKMQRVLVLENGRFN